MGLTHYPFGVSSFGMPVIGGGGIMTTGNVFFVDSGAAARGDAANKGTDPSTPFATIDFAIGRCTASNGDVIFVMPGHAENISVATSLVMDVAGVRVIGLGTGRNRPVLTYTISTGTVEMDAANCSIENIVFFSSVTAVVVGINVDAADCSIINCEMDFDATADDFVTGIDIDAVDRAAVINCRFIAENGTAGMAEAIRMDTANEARIINNQFTGDFTDGCIVMEGAASNSIEMRDNRMWNGHANARGIVNSVASNGIIRDNSVSFEDGQAHAQQLLATTAGSTLNWQVTVHRSSVFDGATTNSHGDLAGTNDPYTIYTVTGDVLIAAIWGICNTSLTGATATIQVGVAGNLAKLLALITATDLDDGDVYTDAGTEAGADFVVPAGGWIALNDGVDIVETPLTANVDAGQLDYYIIWAPVEDGASIISAAAVV